MYDIPFNMDFYFGDDLKEIPFSKNEMINRIQYLKEQEKSYLTTRKN